MAKKPAQPRTGVPTPGHAVKAKPTAQVPVHESGKPWLEVAKSLGATHTLHEPENGRGSCLEVLEWVPAKGTTAPPIRHRWTYPASQLKRDSLAYREFRARSVVRHIEALNER